MIALPRENLVIVTPPKCASTTLHVALCQQVDGAIWIEGPLPHAPGDASSVHQHCVTVPGYFDRCRVAMTWRNPYERAVSLYAMMQERGTDAPIGQYVADLGAGRVDRWFWGWNQSEYARRVTCAGQPRSVNHWLRLDNLAADLAAAGVRADLDRLNVRPADAWSRVLDSKQILDLRPWASPDLRLCDT